MFNIMQRLMGWEYIGTEANLKTYVHPDIIQILNDKHNHNLRHFSKRHSDYPSETIFAKGNTYIYKAKMPTVIWIDNHGHGGYVASGSMKLYRRKKKNK